MNRCSDCEHVHRDTLRDRRPWAVLCTLYPLPDTDLIIEGVPDGQQPYMRARDVRKGLTTCPFFTQAKGRQMDLMKGNRDGTET